MPAELSPPDDAPLECVVCARPLGIFPEDQPDWPTGPICGDCYQAQQMDDEIFWSMHDDG